MTMSFYARAQKHQRCASFMKYPSLIPQHTTKDAKVRLGPYHVCSSDKNWTLDRLTLLHFLLSGMMRCPKEILFFKTTFVPLFPFRTQGTCVFFQALKVWWEEEEKKKLTESPLDCSIGEANIVHQQKNFSDSGLQYYCNVGSFMMGTPYRRQ